MILNNYPNIIIDCIAAAFCFSKQANYFTNDLLKTGEAAYARLQCVWPGKTGLKG